ncbi:S-methyl-5'-thioinosine phosphorylase [Gammaproteobacteria bacterium]
MQSTPDKTLAIIGGSGLTSLPGLEITDVEEKVSTPYGEPSGPLTHGRLHDHEIIFLPRHGVEHLLPPHRVNYRANLWALKEAGIHRILAVNAVGGIHPELSPGRIAIPDQIIDYTFDRAHTYFDGGPDLVSSPTRAFSEKAVIQVTHVDFTDPYCMALRARLLAAAALAEVNVYFGGTYGATQGPRLESRAEIDRMERDGCHMVGMTGMPEAALARELGLCYACCAVVANWAAGRGVEAVIEIATIERVLHSAMDQVRAVMEPLIRGL